MNSKDLVILGESLGMPVNASVDANKLFLLEYNSFVPGRDGDSDIMLPPDGFVQLQSLIEEQVIERVVIDTALPWVAISDYNRLAEHVFSFVRAFERVNVSCLFTMPKPVSTPAIRLKHLLEQNLPVCVSLRKDKKSGKRSLYVDKYIGANVKPGLVEFDLGFGLDESTKASTAIVTPLVEDNVDFKEEEIKPSYFENLDFTDFKSGDSFKKKRANPRRSKETLDKIDFVDSFEVATNFKNKNKKTEVNKEILDEQPDLVDEMLKRSEDDKDNSSLENKEVSVEGTDDGGAEKIDFSSFILGDRKQ
jgi:hypothetical protein